MRPKKRVKTKLRILPLNVEAMTGKSRELLEMLDRRIIYIACVQETKWKGSQAREIRDGQALIQDQISTSPSPRAVDATRGLRADLIT